MILGMVLIISVVALIYAGLLARYVLKQDKGTTAMQEIGEAIRVGAEAFLKRQYKTIGMLSVLLALLILAMYSLTKGWDLGLKMTVGFLFGAAFLGPAGDFGGGFCLP